MGLVLGGISVSRGIAIGKGLLLRCDFPDINEHCVPRPLVVEEITRFRVAINKARQQLRSIRNRIPPRAPADITGFIDTHLLMLEDTALAETPAAIIRERCCNAEWAVKLQCDALVRVFEEMNDPYLRTRKDDVRYVVERILRNLMDQGGHQAARPRLEGRIAIAEDIGPAEMLMLHHQGVAALVTCYGGPNSHTAILARSLGIPAVVGVPRLLDYLLQDELLVVDGGQGLVVAGPGPTELDYFHRRQRQEKRRRAELRKLSKLPAITRDGQPVRLMGNIELPEDVPVIRRMAAAGIGLYRTEMLFIDRSDPPGEEEQFEVYRRIVRAMQGAPVTIRTLDLGADKTPLQEAHHAVATNPAMGLRAIRCCLREPELFAAQIRAILRASAHGRVRMMIPMLTSVQEVEQVLRLVEEEKSVLRRRRQRFDEALPVGGMIEVPAAAVAAPSFARRLDFLSIGTNDLIQYTLAVDRLDEQVNYLYDPLHPAVLRLIRMVLQAGRRAGIPVAMCGEMAGDTRYTRLLLGLGLREFSMYPASLLEVKHVVNTSDVSRLERPVQRILRAERREEILGLVERLNGGQD
ncbi:MAG TPA: phosphoenolpyruvate--protein phosphotransferase [Gammaproteobacteria bacterium]|nr:phosphoenolpyruvate--protein phosphotransferase [Gammaproteobacteria bacterium]